MRVGDKIAPLHHPIFKPANLPDFLAVARNPAAAINYSKFPGLWFVVISVSRKLPAMVVSGRRVDHVSSFRT